MISRPSVAADAMGFNPQEYEALNILRQSYQAGHDLFMPPERARLRFLRWLIHSPGWNTAMDRPLTTPEQTRTVVWRAPWMRGLLG